MGREGSLEAHSNDEPHLHTKVFGNFKNETVDCQIGDSRGRNFVEGRVAGEPFHDIPNATTLLQLEFAKYKEVLVVAIVDRRDFYHQFRSIRVLTTGRYHIKAIDPGLDVRQV